MVRALTLLLLALLLPCALVAEDRGVRVVLPAPEDGAPFSGGVLAGDLLYLSGALGNKPGTLDLRATAGDQAEQTLRNLEAVLQAAEMGMNRIVATTVYVSDARAYPPVGRALVATFGDGPGTAIQPTRSIAEAGIALPRAVVEIAAVAARPGVEVRAILPEGWSAPTTGYAWGVRAGDTVFLAMQAGNHPKTGAISTSVTEQTKQALRNIESLLATEELDLGHLVACRVYLGDARDFAAMNTGWRSVFEGVVPPTRATIQARTVRLSYGVTIQCTAEARDKQVIKVTEGGNPPFSPALLVGDQLYLSGMVGRGPDGYPTDLGDQTNVVLDRLEAHLEKAGMGFDDVVSAEVWLDDVRHYDAMNAAYRARVPAPRPARATVASRLMSPEAKVEIAMIAVRGKR